MIKHIFTMLVLITFTGCLLTENEEQKESNYQDNRSSSSVYYSSEEQNQIEQQNQNGIKAGEYKSQTVISNVSYIFDNGMNRSGVHTINITYNLKPDNTFSSKVKGTIHLDTGEKFEINEYPSGTWSSTNSEICFNTNPCKSLRNITSTSYEYYVDLTEPIRSTGLMQHYDFAGYVRMNRQ